MEEIPKTYDPNVVEPKWYQHWLDRGAFRADETSSKPAFSIVIPPPNITGVLTMGHVLNNTIQDVLARRARMTGHEVLWLPGVDHAGVATQTAVEKHLIKTEKKTRRDYGREEFLKRVVEWQDKHGGIIIEQLKRLGCSCDWSRQRYTFDADYVRAVGEVFVTLYERGLIYRGRRMINWDPKAQTALSDEEVIPTPTKSTLFYAKYEVVDQPGRFVVVATTRPETIMADVALAVHPNDRRYADLLGKKVRRPLAPVEIPVISDDAIDPEFGTGVLKVTPAHDTVDFEIGQRHQLPVIDVLTDNGRINCPDVPELHGLDRFEARKLAGEMLEQSGLLEKAEPHQSNVGYSERANVPIEPRLSEQWFLRYPKTDEALRVVREHLIRFFPQHWEKVYAQWLEHIQDWCISRQIWWGHRIPAWYRDGETRVQFDSPGDGWRQDEDTLDTWFSSWLWAYETMDAETRAKFYPTSVLVTAPDIIFFWVARMIIAGLEFRPGKSERVEDNIAFRDVFFTGLIRDAKGRKMSKSLGNSPDPLDLMAKFGADGLRFGLMRIAPTGADIRFDEKQIEEGRNFATKLWNAARFRRMHGPTMIPSTSGDDRLKQSMPNELSIYSIEILARLNETIAAVDDAFRAYEFNAIAHRLYDFFWNDYCDWFVEAAKSDIFADDESRKRSVLAVMDVVLSATLRLLHPLMPHITEELWAVFGFGAESIQFTSLPEPFDLPNESIASRARGAKIYETAELGRNLRAEAGVPSNQKTPFVLRAPDDGADLETLSRLLNAERITVDEQYSAAAGTPMASTPLGQLFLAVEIDADAERERLDKEIAKTTADLKATQTKLSNRNFVDRAPAEVVAEHRQREADLSTKLLQLQHARERLS